MATSIGVVVSATDSASSVFERIGLSADRLDKQIEDLGKRIAAPEIDLKDAKFAQGMIRAAERLDKLSAKMAEPGVDLSDRGFQSEILKINAQLDRLGARHVTATVDVKTERGGLLSRLFGGGGGGLAGLFGGGAQAGGAAASTGAGGLGSLGPAAQGGAIAAAIAAAAALAPALLPLGLGGLVGGGATLGAFDIGKKADKQMQALAKQLQSAQAAQAAAASGRTRRAAGTRIADVQGQMAALRKQSGPELAIFGAFKDLGATFKDVFAGALKAGGGPGGGPSFLTGLEGILKQIAGFVKSIGPQLGQMFRASLPFISAFVSFLEEAAKTLLPVFVQMLKQMAPFLPIIAQGLTALVQGLADMLKAMGPQGMEASAKIFVGLMKAVGGILTVTGKAINFFAIAVQDVAHWLQQHWHVVEWLAAPVVTAVTLIIRHWNDFRHQTAVIFDGVRHDIAHTWDQIYQNTIGAVIRFGHDVEARYDAIRSAIFTTLNHLPGQLWNIAKTAIENIIKGAASVVPRIKSFFSGLAHDVVQVFKNIWGWFSPSAVMFQGGKSLMEGLAQGIKAHENQAVAAAASAAHRVANTGAGVQRWRGLVLKALGMEGLSPMLAGNVLYQMQTESGGNPNAINLTDINAQRGDPSRGLMQVIGSTFAAYHWPGTSSNIYDPLANIAAALNYARHVYGPTLMSGGMGIGSGRGYATGSWSVPYTGPAVVHQGEMIIPAAAAAAVRAGAGGGNTYAITVNVPPGANQAEAGRLMVQAIREFERRSGPGWRK